MGNIILYNTSQLNYIPWIVNSFFQLQSTKTIKNLSHFKSQNQIFVKSLNLFFLKTDSLEENNNTCYISEHLDEKEHKCEMKIQCIKC